MTRSRLYRNLGWTGGTIFEAIIGDRLLTDDDLAALAFHRGSDDPSSHTPSTAQIDVAGYLSPLDNMTQVRLSAEASAWIESRCYATANVVQQRFNGRTGAATTVYRGRRGFRSSSLTAASWDSVYQSSAETWQPSAGSSLGGAAGQLLRPSWTPGYCYFYGDGDTWAATPEEPITAGDLMRILSDRLHLFSARRNAIFRIETLPAWEERAAIAATNVWPLPMSRVISPTEWSQPADLPTEYELKIATPDGARTVYASPTETPFENRQPTRLDWTDFVSRSEHWRRVYGVTARTSKQRWSLPRLEARIDLMIASPLESVRRAAGMLLNLDVGDPVPLAGDWHPAVAGMCYCTSLDETITPEAWTITLGLIPQRWINGVTAPPIGARTWNQTTAAWDAATTTWNEGTAP